MEFPIYLESFKEFGSTTNVFVIIFISLSVLAWFLTRKRVEGKLPPGPWGLPLVGYLPFLGKEPHVTLWNMKEKYGDIMGLYLGTKYTVIMNEWSITKEVYSNPYSLDRAPNLFDLIPRIGFTKTSGEEWLEQRRFCIHSFKDLGLGKGHWEDLIMDGASNFVQKLKYLNGKATDISHILSTSVSSNILSMLIGRRLDEEKERDNVQLALDFTDISFKYLSPSFITTVIPGLSKMLEVFRIAGYHTARRIINQFSSFTRNEINNHKTSPDLKDVQDFINSYLEKLSNLSPLEKHYFSEDNLEGNVNVLYLGASDTINSSLNWLLRLMCKHQDVQERVHQELREVLGKEGKTRYEERHKIPYTFAVLMEAQRVSSIVAINSTRKAAKDINVRGYTIPKDAEFTTNLWALHNDPKYWEKPEEFRPERFLTENETKLLKNPESYAPFSLGRRKCPGETIAWMEILHYFSEIMKNFKVSTPPGAESRFEVINGLVAHLRPQALCFVARQN